jgi:HK97 family phage major capsid protein
MNLKEQLAALLKAMQDTSAAVKAEGREFTDEEAAEFAAKAAEAEALKARIDSIDKSQKMLETLVNLGKSDEEAEPDLAAPGTKDNVPLGDRFIKSEAYRQFQKSFPSGAGNGSMVSIDRVRVGSMKEWLAFRKANLITTDIGHIQPLRWPTVDLVQAPQLTLLDLISRGTTAGNFEYVQITAVNRGAAIVPEATSNTDNAALKPLSDITTQLADAKVFTYADGYEVTNQMLSDAPAFASYLNQELSYNLDSVVEDMLLNGTGTNGEPTGILHTTGVLQQTVASTDPIDVVKATRRGITQVLLQNGGTVTAILLSPEDAENIDLMQDGNERFYGNGPFGTGPTTLWGRPTVISEKLVSGQFILGDFRQVALLDREGLSILAFNQHKDYAQRNLVYVRAEQRAAQVIWRPSRLVVGEVGTPAPGDDE